MLDILATGGRYTSLFVALAGLWLLIIVLGAGIWYYRRRWWLSESKSDVEPFTLADLRHLRDTGGLTEEEYRKVRAAMIGGPRVEPDISRTPRGAAEPPDPPREAGF